MPDLFIVEQSETPSAGNKYTTAHSYLSETDVSDATEEVTVTDLMDGQFNEPVKVYKLVDVTAEFREKLQAEINKSENGVIPDHLARFMAE